MLLGLLCLVVAQAAIAQNCLGKLEVVKGRHTRTISSEDPSRYLFTLTNKSDQEKLYTLSVEPASDNCELQAMPARLLSNQGHLSFQWKNGQDSGNQLKLKAGQSATIQLQVALLQPIDDPLWQCLSVVASASQCREKLRAGIRLWMEPHQTDNY